MVAESAPLLERPRASRINDEEQGCELAGVIRMTDGAGRDADALPQDPGTAIRDLVRAPPNVRMQRLDALSPFAQLDQLFDSAEADPDPRVMAILAATAGNLARQRMLGDILSAERCERIRCIKERSA